LTEKSEPATTIGVEPKETGVGSNFVSNYPPYSFWRTESLADVYQALEGAPDPQAPLGLYVHIPFCRRRCKFCYYKVFTDKNASEVQRYVDAVLAEAAIFAQRAAFAGRSLRFVYFGGGTPSYISARHLESLFNGLKAILNWDEVQEVTFECEPGTLTLPKLETIRRVGVTRVSLGIENFNDRILEENGRAHLTKEIYRVEPWIRNLEFDQLNIDLIAGMVGETWETWKDSVRKTIEMDPDSVTIYQMELPFNTVYSRRLLDGSAVPIADWSTKRAWHDYAFHELAQVGYETSSAYTMVKSGRDGRFVYRDSVWHGCDLLGIGISSFGHVGGVHFQNLSQWEPYLQKIEAGELALERAFDTDPDERQTRETILLLKRGHLEVDYFKKKHGIDILEKFRSAFERLRERGMLDFDSEMVRLTRDGLLRVDQLLPEFYAERYQNVRYT
jgi:oxygen-independent coproporphyrinogen-3 oxidase